MYRFLDRPVEQLDEHHRFLLAAMRTWVEARVGGRCACRAVLRGFVVRGVANAFGAMTIALGLLSTRGVEGVRCRSMTHPVVGDDEAKVLELFDAGLRGECGRLRRIAATMVDEDSALRLAAAAEWVALQLARTEIVEKDR